MSPELSPPVPTASQLESWCVELATGAAEVVRDGRRSGRPAGAAVTTKSSDTDLVTEVDRAAERWLREHLADRRPDDAVLGEEGGTSPGSVGSASSGVRWVLDPIDGTVNFVLGLPQYAVSVAAEVAGRVEAGAVANPVSGEVFHARRGGGAWLRSAGGSELLSGPREITLSTAVVATGFAYERAMRARQAEVVARLLSRVGDVRRLGSAALDLCFVAAGRLDAYFEVGLHEWDHAAGALVAAEAGCVVGGLYGRPASGAMVAAAGPRLAPEFFALLESAGADAVGA